MKKIVSLFLLNAALALNSTAADWQMVGLSSKVTGVQPMTGLVLWPEEAKKLYSTYGDAHALEYSYLAPCKVVKNGEVDGPIEYDWTYLEKILDDVKSRNHQAVLRFFYEYPGVPMVDGDSGTTAVPAYIKAQKDYKEAFVDVKDDGPTYYADWSNDELKRFTKQFYTDFSARYGKDPRIAFLEVGFGHWSEYHIYNEDGVDLNLGKNFPDKKYQKEFFLHLSEVLDIPWAISIDAADDEYTSFATDKALRKLSFGLFDDSFMHKGHELGSDDGYNEECWNTMGENRWKTGVCGGEISYYSKSDQKNFTNLDKGMYGLKWDEQSDKYHITFMIANDNPKKNGYENSALFKKCSMMTGYHFVVTSCKTDGTQTKIVVKNDGVAPLYKDAYFAIGSIRSGESLRGLLPKESVEVTIDAALECDGNGNALVKPVIESDYILDTQTIEYDCDIATTGAEVVKQSAEGGEHQRYTVLGKKVSDDYRGIVVTNGKKVLEK